MSLEPLYERAPVWGQTVMLNGYALRLARHRGGARHRQVLRMLLDSQYWPQEKRVEYQNARLREIVRLAYARSAFYRALFDNLGMSPMDVRTSEDLTRLPVLTKEIVRDRGNQLMTAQRPQRDWRHGHTSGTTGSPLGLWYSREMSVLNDAVDARQKLWAGRRAQDWVGVFLGRRIVPASQNVPPFWRANYVHRQLWFSSFHLDAQNLDIYVQEIRRRRVQFLEGYPSTMFIVAQHVLRRGLQLPMTAVFTSSETLHGVQREAIRDAFGCEPTDFYGHAERVIFAAECEAHDGKHVAEEYGLVEVTDDHGGRVPDGQVGFLVGTTLHNTATPLLRYRTGDLSAIRREVCSCGRTLVRIENVATKAEDIVVTPDGRMISPSVLTHPFKPFPQIVKSQIVQERVDQILVKIIPSADFTPEHQATLVTELQRRLGYDVTIEVKLVEEIPLETSGKFRWVISRVPHHLHFDWAESHD